MIVINIDKILYYLFLATKQLIIDYRLNIEYDEVGKEADGSKVR